MNRPSTPQEFGFLIDDLVASTVGVQRALVASADGLVLYSTAGTDRDVADSLAAIVTGLMAQGNAMASLLGDGGCQQAMIRFPGCTCLLMAINELACLATFVTVGAKLLPVSDRMADLIEAAGTVLTPQLRDDLRALQSLPERSRA